jgi:hypothetical protein
MLKALARMPVLLFLIAMTTHAQKPNKLQLANRLLDAIQFDSWAERLAAPQTPSSDSASFDRYRAFIKKNLDMGRLRERAAARYAELFTEHELTELVSFLESPTGRKYTDSQPKVGEVIQPIIAAMFREHFDEYRHDVLKLP